MRPGSSTAETPGPDRRTRNPSRQFRADIEGMRAVAVLGVVLYHAHVGVLRGGFAGVDVFFVVSGYLITGLLWRELTEDRRISLAGFYGRRARRLLPASIFVIVVTALAARKWMPPLQISSVMKDGLASALYVGNYRFAINQTDYLANSSPSPFQHYWSLGVEEQFYLLWPLLLVAGSMVWRRQYRHQRSRWMARGEDGAPSRMNAAALLGVVTIASLMLSLWLTHANQPWAFFSLPTRAWELGAGGLVALAAPTSRRLPRPAAAALGWGGLVVTIGSLFWINPNGPFPGTAALAPVLGTLAVLAAGEALSQRTASRPAVVASTPGGLPEAAASAAKQGPVAVLGRRPMRMIGRISYSWYLWHWPFLILAPYVLGYALHLWQNLLVAALSGVVATLSFLLLETPARTSRWLAAVPRRSLLTGAAVTAVGVVTCLLVATNLPSVEGHGVAPVASLGGPPKPGATTGRLARSDRPVSAGSNGAPTTTLDPLQAQVDYVTSEVQAQVARSVGVQDVPSNLNPSLSTAGSSNSPTFYDGCMDSYLDTSVRQCVFGDVGAATSIVLFGDSHAAMWFPAADDAANQHGWQLFNFAKATCPPLFINIYSPVLGRNFSECNTWRQNVLARIQQIHPALVILGVARHYTSIYGFTPYDQQWLQGMSQMVSTIRRMGSKVLVIGPVPKPQTTVYDCLSQHLSDATACTEPVDVGINELGLASERATVESAGGAYLDVQPWFCTAQTCAAIVDNLLVWRDDNHISEPYSAFLGPAMSAELASVLGGS